MTILTGIITACTVVVVFVVAGFVPTMVSLNVVPFKVKLAVKLGSVEAGTNSGWRFLRTVNMGRSGSGRLLIS